MNYYNYFTEIEEHFVRRRGKYLLVSPMDWHLIASWREAGVPLHVALRGIDIAMDSYHARQTRGNTRINSLCYCHDAVMDAYAGHLESHVGEASPEHVGDTSNAAMNTESTAAPAAEAAEAAEEFSRETLLDFLYEKIDEIKSLAAKQYECPSVRPDRQTGSAQENDAQENIERVSARLQEIIAALKAGGKPDTEALERDLRILDELLIEGLRATIMAEEAETWVQEAKKDRILKVYKKQLPRENYEKMLDNFHRDKIRKKYGIGELSLFRL